MLGVKFHGAAAVRRAANSHAFEWLRTLPRHASDFSEAEVHIKITILTVERVYLWSMSWAWEKPLVVDKLCLQRDREAYWLSKYIHALRSRKAYGARIVHPLTFETADATGSRPAIRDFLAPSWTELQERCLSRASVVDSPHSGDRSPSFPEASQNC